MNIGVGGGHKGKEAEDEEKSEKKYHNCVDDLLQIHESLVCLPPVPHEIYLLFKLTIAANLLPYRSNNLRQQTDILHIEFGPKVRDLFRTQSW